MKYDKTNIKLYDIPGSIFVENRSNTLVVQVKRKRKYTGLKDTPTNRKTAERIKEKLYLEVLGLSEKTVITRKTLKILFDEYISEREITKSPQTIRSDKLTFKNLISKNIVADPELIETEVKRYLKNSKVEDISKNIYLRTFQTFLNWLHEKGSIPERLNLKKKYYIKIADKENEIFEQNEIDLLISHFNSKDKEFSILIKFLCVTGLRINEALNLTWQQLKKDRIILSNKINKSSEVLIISENIYNIVSELKEINQIKVFRWKYSSYSRLNRRLSDAMKHLNIEKRNRSFHEFRKTFLFNLQKNSVPVEIAQKLMRHKNISVTIKNYQLIKEIEQRKAIETLLK